MFHRGVRNSNNNVKIVFATVISLIALICVTVYGFKILFLNKGNNSRYNSILYAQVLNNAMPIVEVTSFEEEVLAEENITVKGEVLRLLGINMYNPLSIMSREISFFSNLNYQSPPTVATTEPISDYGSNIDPFTLPPGQISGQTVGNDNSNNGNTGNNSGDDLPNTVVTVQDPSLKGELNAEKPKVLIYHTHTTEAFAPNGNYNQDAAKNIVAVGDALEKELEGNYGVSVLHDKTMHSAVFNESYSRSRETLEKYLKQYGNFDLIIDMHRDAVYSKGSVTTKMNGENVSKIMFVLTKKNPHFDKNAAVVNELMAISNKLFPSYCRGIYYYNYGSKYFNQDKSNNAILIEVGAHINTHQESLNSAKYMARVIAEYLKNKK